jgi:hypothetical protein
MPKQSKGQAKTIDRVMHEFKHGELKLRGGRRTVKNPKQAIAIALRESGTSKFETPKKNRVNLAGTKRRERAGKTGQDRAEGHNDAVRRRSSARARPASASPGTTKAGLYAEAKRKGIAGRSTMTKGELQRALHR